MPAASLAMEEVQLEFLRRAAACGLDVVSVRT
jgi:hypothetical protein